MAISRGIGLARLRSGGMPQVNSAKYKTSEALIKGSVLAVDANGELVLATSDGTHPADGDIVGFALEDAGSKPGYDFGHATSAVYMGRVQEVSYLIANTQDEYSSQISADGAAVTTAAQTHVGEKYKLSKAANGLWYVDTSDFSPDNVVIVDFDADLNIVIWRLLLTAINNQ